MCRKNKAKSIIALVMAIGFTFSATASAASSKNYSAEDVVFESEILPISAPLGDGVALSENEATEFDVTVDKDGDYNLCISYIPTDEIVLSSAIEVQVGEHSNTVDVYSLWSDESKEYRSDRYENEIVPTQRVVQAYNTEPLIDSVSLDKTPIVYSLKKGTNLVKIVNGRAPINIREIFAVEPKTVPAYQAPDVAAGAAGIIQVEAENYTQKSDSYIRPKNVQNKALVPYELNRKLLNVIDDSSFKRPGQWIEWEVNVPQDGSYMIGFKYLQSLKENMPVYAKIYIDGEVPCEELQSYPFDYTTTSFKNETLSIGDEAMKFKLNAGKHTIRVKLDGAPVEEFNRRARAIAGEISDIGIEVGKLAGDNVSTFRNWEIESYFPGLTAKLQGYSDELKTMYDEFVALSGSNAKVAAQLRLASENLDLVLKKPKKIPAKLSLLSKGSGSVTQLLSDFSTDVVLQNLSLDAIYIYNEAELPKAKVSAFENAGEGIKRFFSALVSPSSAYGVGKKQEGVLNVWVNRPINYVETMQILADTRYTIESGVEVKMSVMPNEQKMILSNATDTAPDVVLGSTAHSPFELALRGAVTDFNQFPDFADFIKESFSVDSLDGFVHNGKIYGMIEAQDFFVLMYRKDVMDSLGVKLPETWDDVAEIMPVLRRNGMNFFIPLSSFQGNKPLYATSPFIHQAGGQFYAADGHETTVNSEESIAGFTTLTGLYSYYSLQPHIPNFYNSFRYATVPIGVGAFGDYVKLVNAAPEIADRWEIAQAPGTLRADGTIDRSYTAAERSCMIFERSEMKNESWDFIKWWLSEETQTEFSYTLQTKYGPEYLWNSANLKAFDKLELPQEHKDVILKQWEEIREVPKHPAGYMLERELTNAWLSIVDQGVNPRVALDKAALNINREMDRKLEEFGYQKNGEKVKDYKILTAREILFGE